MRFERHAWTLVDDVDLQIEQLVAVNGIGRIHDANSQIRVHFITAQTTERDRI